MLQKAPAANRRFAELVEHFITVQVDTKNGRHPLTKTLRVHRGVAYVLFLQPAGDEITRLTNPRDLKSIIAKMEHVEKNTRVQRLKTNANLLDYVLTNRPRTAALNQRVQNLVSKLSHPRYQVRAKATRELLDMGAVTYDVLANAKVKDEESKARISLLVAKLQPLARAVQLTRVDRDVDLLADLAATNPRARRRLETILPPAVPLSQIKDWWRKNGTNYRWHAELDRYVPSLSLP